MKGDCIAFCFLFLLNWQKSLCILLRFLSLEINSTHPFNCKLGRNGFATKCFHLMSYFWNRRNIILNQRSDRDVNVDCADPFYLNCFYYSSNNSNNKLGKAEKKKNLTGKKRQAILRDIIHWANRKLCNFKPTICV